ncbi:DUF4268 domain-containing protein [Pectobacterium parmentieri]|uniref:DUF4268 domain-containing protein n=1 Tax=Pectobacterium parmentieri TaxID=1905730 RepID=A0ABS0RYG9_PECPM|nr:DUF4268 domain-containing protein [Pectobacterium parmentieri]MBI0471286.1 DUF4268 domain-containing protein [Pectobacterium parmentieri]MBI0493898.1 DUF4268 domain-containing protein [Pectobacterium parmentieri]MBI0554680.1 DUF4268 domain-containing protein [Pectobacterium parmentieri]MBI0568164.1 DUF4268 domain-containing protein [Pectobacterium parmentieri]MBI0573133.1 DUF4268 domain-containing protein [Pectobacterium parmentieri]
MYKVDTPTNSLHALQEVSFSSLGFTERYHLQEWLAKNPQALTRDNDDELLIIQKEFAGFDDTKERLDLLAIDKQRNLVIIENKLDDSGRDVIWQALKYAGYCANLRKDQILEIFQRYLDKYEPEEARPAAEVMAEFLECESLDEVQINQSRTQRVMMVAASFRKEVTNTALWLMQFGLRVQCFKVKPYKFNDEVFVDIRQVIPTPEAESYMIGMAQKEAEEQSASGELKTRHQLRKAFWTKMLERLKASTCTLYNNISPSTDHWLSAGSGISAVSYNLIFSKKEIRVELWIAKASAESNTFAFNWLYERKEMIESTFGHALKWESLPGKKSCRISFATFATSLDESNWREMIDWLLVNLTAFEKALDPFITPLNIALKAISNAPEDTEELETGEA